MPELQSCYFCGTPDDVQAYAVIPPRFAPDEADQREVVLCEQCKDKLLRIVEPLADRLDASLNAGPETGASAPVEADASAETEPPETAATATDMFEGGVTIDAGGGEAAGEEESPTLSPPESGGSDSAAEASESATGQSSPTAGSQSPTNYRKAMRLLSNREFPMERYDVEGLLAGAYDMENEEVDAILDHAIESGRLVDEDGTLKQP